MEKGVVVEYILSLIRENIKLLEEELDSIQQEKNSLTKSSAGDKHETSRALMQSEYDKLYQNYSLQLKQQKVIEALQQKVSEAPKAAAVKNIIRVKQLKTETVLLKKKLDANKDETARLKSKVESQFQENQELKYLQMLQMTIYLEQKMQVLIN